MSHCIVSYIVLNSQIGDSMYRNSSVIGLMDGITSDVGVHNSADHMEMNWVPTKLKGLTCIKESKVFNSSN